MGAVAVLASYNIRTRDPATDYSYCRRHTHPGSSLVLSACLLPCLSAAMTLLEPSRTLARSDPAMLAFYLAAACSLLPHLSLLRSADMQLLWQWEAYAIVGVLTLLPQYLGDLMLYENRGC